MLFCIATLLPVAYSGKNETMNYSNCAKKSSSLTFWLGILAVVALTACNREQPRSYSISKENPAASDPNTMSSPGMGGALPAGHPDMGGAMRPSLTWKTPANWTELPPTDIRVGSFEIKAADGKQALMTIIPLVGMAGGDFANVNLWRQQAGLAAITEDEFQKTAQHLEVGGQPADLYEQIGKDAPEARGILGVIQHREGTSWFFKMAGDPGLVTDQKATFVEFLKSVKFEATQIAAMPAGQPAVGGATMPAGHPDIAMTPAPATGPISHAGQPTWQVPAGWQEVPGGQMLVAKFTIAGEAGAQAAVNVSLSGGGLEMNLNRWRQQVGLGELSGDALLKSTSSIDVTGGKATFVEMTGTDAKAGKAAQLVGVMVQQPGQSGQAWFYKLMGDPKIVQAQKDAFTKFVQGVKY